MISKNCIRFWLPYGKVAVSPWRRFVLAVYALELITCNNREYWPINTIHAGHFEGTHFRLLQRVVAKLTDKPVDVERVFQLTDL